MQQRENQEPHGNRAARLYAATAAIYLAMFAYTLLKWDSIPDPVPMHVGVSGEVDNWAPKTFLSVTGVLWIGAAVSAAVALLVPRSSLARATRPNAADTNADALPFSETAARRAELLIGETHRFAAELLLFTAVVMALVQLILVIPDVHVPMWAFGIALALYTAWAIWRSAQFNRQAKRDLGALEPDAQEQTRIAALKHKAGAGVYSEPRDPMAVAVLPSEPVKLQINSAHPEGRRQLTRIATGIVATIALPLIVVVAI